MHQQIVLPGRLGNMSIAIEPQTALRGSYPLILTLDTHGVPHRWISWQHACYYYAKDQVAWATGAHAFTVYGGMSRLTGLRSSITASSIIAIKGKAMAMFMSPGRPGNTIRQSTIKFTRFLNLWQFYP